MTNKAFRHIIFATLICSLSGCSSIGTGSSFSNYVPPSNTSDSAHESVAWMWWLGTFSLESFSCNTHTNLSFDYFGVDLLSYNFAKLSWSINGVPSSKYLPYEFRIVPNVDDGKDYAIQTDPNYKTTICFDTKAITNIECIKLSDPFVFVNEDTLLFCSEDPTIAYPVYSDGSLAGVEYEGGHRCVGQLKRV